MKLMFSSIHPFRLFIFFLFFSKLLFADDMPSVMAKPEIKEIPYQDVLNAVKKQKWSMARILADDYSNSSLSKLIQWMDYTRPGSKFEFSELKNFLRENPNWPKIDEIKKKIESSINKSISPKRIVEWYDSNPPITNKGTIDYFEAQLKLGQVVDLRSRVKKIWIHRNLTFRQQKYFIKKYSKYWDADDNWKRFDRLMWEGKNFSAKKTLYRIKGDYRALGNARLALSNRAGNVTSLISRVPYELRNDPGLIYERMRWRRKAKLDTAKEFLFNPPSEIKNHRNWWINARIVIRRLINKKKYNEAYKLLKNHNLPLISRSGVEAEFLAGWIKISYLKSPKVGLEHFTKLYNSTNSPKLKSLAAFWIAKCYESFDKKKSKDWYRNASLEEFNFYGQNASLILGSNKISFDRIEKKRPENIDNIFEILKILKSFNFEKKMYPFLKKAVELCQTNEEKNYMFNIISRMEDKSLIIKLSRDFDSIPKKFLFPIIDKKVPQKFQNKKDLILIHSIIKQESAFMINAKSHAGARGLMQLMPFTARKVAQNLNIKYYKSALTSNPEYNILLGTTYIKSLIKKFKGSLPLALAGYNAGPRRVEIWIKRYGNPLKNQISMIDWIESIPIYETRNYVKKVITNYRVYKSIFDVRDPESFNIVLNNLKTY